MDLYFSPGQGRQASRICEPVATQGAATQASEQIGASSEQGHSGGKHVAGRRSQEVRLRSGNQQGRRRGERCGHGGVGFSRLSWTIT